MPKYKLYVDATYPDRKYKDRDARDRNPRELFEAMGFELLKHSNAEAIIFTVVIVEDR